jgi:hypothetical protein
MMLARFSLLFQAMLRLISPPDTKLVRVGYITDVAQLEQNVKIT